MDQEFFGRHEQLCDGKLNETIDKLIDLAGNTNHENTPLYRTILFNIVKLIQEDSERWDIKILRQALKELEHSFTLLRQFRRRRKATVFGSARTAPEHPDYQLAVKLGKLLADNGYMSITGAGGGIMEAAHVGAGVDSSIGLNIDLPFEQYANIVMQKPNAALLDYKFFFTRKLFFAKEADALILFPGGFGTQDESFEILTLVQTGKSPVVPIILIDSPETKYWEHWLRFVENTLAKGKYINEADLNLYQYAHSAEEAIDIIGKFYKNYHSSRWIDDQIYLRIHRPLPDTALDHLNQHFASICDTGGFTHVAPHDYERDEPELSELARLAFHFNAKDYGLLRQVIDYTNQF